MLICLRRGLTVAKNSFPSSLPMPSIMFSKPDSVTPERRGRSCRTGDPPSLSSSSSRDGSAQSMSSTSTMLRFGIVEVARWRNESSTL
jgi:hypothetical protein